MKRFTLAALMAVTMPAAFVHSACAQHPEPPLPPDPPGITRSEHRSTEQGWLGVSVEDVTAKLARKKNIKTEEGAYVRDVEPKSPADSAGVRDGDVIVEFDGKRIDDAADLTKAVRRLKPATNTTVVLMREGNKKSLRVSVGKIPRRHAHDVRISAFGAPRMGLFRESSSFLGLELRTLNEQLGEYFDAPGKKGVLVERVRKNSAAEKGGFKAGDVITKVGKESIEDVRDVWNTIRDYDEGDKVDVEILRKGSHKTLTIEVEEDGDSHGYRFWFDNLPHGDMLEQLEIPPIELDQLHREGEWLKLEMDGVSCEMKALQENLRKQMTDLRERLKEEAGRIRRSVTI